MGQQSELVNSELANNWATPQCIKCSGYANEISFIHMQSSHG